MQKAEIIAGDPKDYRRVISDSLGEVSIQRLSYFSNSKSIEVTAQQASNPQN